MRKLFALLLTGVMLLSLTACKKKDGAQPNGETTQPQQETQQPEKEVVLIPVTDIELIADATEGRKPSEIYRLPLKKTDMIRWDGETALLAQEETASFYALEGKESNPVLLCWDGHQGEFDWLYATPRSIAPQLWFCDMDKDDEPELVVNCYGGSGTGVSIEYLYVMEKGEDGSLIANQLDWKALRKEMNKQLQTVNQDGKFYAALGDELTDISEQVQEAGVEKVEICLGQIANYTCAEDGITCSFGVTAEGEGIPHLAMYVGTVKGELSYKDGTFVLKNLHFEGN